MLPAGEEGAAGERPTHPRAAAVAPAGLLQGAGGPAGTARPPAGRSGEGHGCREGALPQGAPHCLLLRQPQLGVGAGQRVSPGQCRQPAEKRSEIPPGSSFCGWPAPPSCLSPRSGSSLAAGEGIFRNRQPWIRSGAEQGLHRDELSLSPPPPHLRPPGGWDPGFHIKGKGPL